MKTITITTKEGGFKEVNAQQAIRMQHDSHSSYSFSQYVTDLMHYFGMTTEEATKEVNEFFNFKNK